MMSESDLVARTEGQQREAGDLSSWMEHPHRLAVDGKGYVWRVYDDGMWSMAPTNPDNSLTPEPITFYDARLNAENERLRTREKDIQSIILNGAATESEKWEAAVAMYLRHEAHAVDCAHCSEQFRAMAARRDEAVARADAAEARLTQLRERAESEIADATVSESYHAEFNNGGELIGQQARRFAWETVVRLAAASVVSETGEPG